MKLWITITLAAFFILPLSAFAETKTITHTVQQPFGGSQTPDEARTAGITRAKREALEQFGTYIESTTVVKNSQIDSDEILALTAGVTKAEVLKQKNYTDGDGFGLEITVKVELDTSVLDKSLKILLEDRNHLKDLKAARDLEKKLLTQISELQKENQKKGKTKQQSANLKKSFQTANQRLLAVEFFDKAIALWDGKKYSNSKEAIEYFTQAIHLGANYASIYTNRGTAYVQLKRIDLAIADYATAIRLDPKYSAAYYNRGVAYNELNKLDLAIKDYSQAIRFDPNDTSAYNNRGISYSRMKQFDLARADYAKALQIDPNDVVAYYNRAHYYHELKEFDSAIADYSQAIQLDPDLASAYSNRGSIYSDIKQYDRAISDFSQAIRLDPNLALAYSNRGQAFANNNQLIKAMADCDQAIHLDPNLASAYRNRATAYIMLKNDAKACTDLETACKLGECAYYELARQSDICK